MNKETFLTQLDRLLYDIPKEEREEAMDYYRSYFEDAGVENEAAVIEELGSPQKIAASIKEGINGTGDRSGFLKNPPQLRTESRRKFSDSDFQKEEEHGPGKAARNASYRRYDQYESRRKKDSGGMDRNTKLIIGIILAVFTLPVWGGLVSGIAGLLIAAVSILGLFSIGGLAGGVACIIAGIIRFCSFSLVKGLLILGIGMLLTAGGGISIVFLLLLCGRFLPWVFRQTVSVFHKIWNWGRSMA